MKPKVMIEIERKLDTLAAEVKRLAQVVEGGKTAAAPKVTKADLMKIDGVGPATADKILKLLK